MARQLSDIERKKVLADYAMTRNYSETARMNGVSDVCVRNTVRKNSDTLKVVEEKREENLQAVLEFMDRKNEKLQSILGKILDALDDTEKIAKTPASQLATAYGILIDKTLLIGERQDQQRGTELNDNRRIEVIIKDFSDEN